MRSSPLYIALIITISVMSGDKLSSVRASKTQTPISAKTCDKMMVCNCNVKQDFSLREAVRALEKQMEQLIALVNKTTTPTPQPTPLPG